VKTLSQVKALDAPNPKYVEVRATVSFIKHDAKPYYLACPDESCAKKVWRHTLGGNGH
jgi:hypothetical protein